MTPQARPLVDHAELTEIELFIRRRMKEQALGEHASVFRGPGADFVGLRDWHPGDRLSTIDWPQSTLTNFSPVVIREHEQAGPAPILVVADRSSSTWCGTGGLPIAAGIARAIATIGLSAVYGQDPFGVMVFGDAPAAPALVAPRVGRTHVFHCLEAYQGLVPMQPVRHAATLAGSLATCLRRPALVPLISDFLFTDVPRVVREFAELNTVHDVCLLVIDSAFAADLPDVSAGWVAAWDVETGRSRLMSRRQWRTLAARVGAWQDEVCQMARDADLDVVRIGLDPQASRPALQEFVMRRKLRKG